MFPARDSKRMLVRTQDKPGVLVRIRVRFQRLQKLWDQLPGGSRSSGSSYARPQGLWEQLSRSARGSGSSSLEAPEALGAAISTLQRLEEHPS